VKEHFPRTRIRHQDILVSVLPMNKQHILSEIKRTAEANGGVPLGRERFRQETGIKDTDWGKFWARWSDALAEVGFQPNRLRAAYDETWFVEEYIALVRELGHLPSAAELRVRTYQQPGFPHKNTFLKWGRKHQIAAKINDYCSQHEGYDDVLALYALVLGARPASSDERAESKEEAVVGAVYLVKSGRYHKIGSTNAVGRREYELAIQLPEKVTVVHEIRTDDPAGIEAYWHTRFSSKRKRGEWFALSPDDVKAFKRRKFM
jgi:hypothetical protein